MSAHDKTLPADASPLRKISAAAVWGDAELMDQYVTEALEAGIRPGLVEYARDSSLGKRAFDMELWQESLPTLNDEERAAAISSMARALRSGQ